MGIAKYSIRIKPALVATVLFLINSDVQAQYLSYESSSLKTYQIKKSAGSP